MLFRSDRVVFGMNEKKSGAFESREELFKNSGLNHKTEVSSGILEEECKQIWESFFKQKRANSIK